LAQATLCYMGTQLTPPRRAQPTNFRRCLLRRNGRPSQLLLSTCTCIYMYFCLLLYLDDAPNKESATEYDSSDEGIVGLNVNIFGRPFVKRFALCYRSAVLSVCPVCLLTFVHCGQTVGRIKMKLGMHVGLGPGHIVLDGDPAPPPPKGYTPNFRPISVAAKWLHGSRCHLVWS